MFEVRITRFQLEGLNTIFKKAIFFQEGDGEKVQHHLQGIIYDEITSRTVRDRLKKHYKLVGNKDYKVSLVKDEEKYLAYIAKEKNLYFNTTDIDIESYYDKWEKKPTSKKSRLQEIFEDAESSDTYTLVSHCIDWYIRNEKPINKHTIMGMVLTHQATYDRHFRELLTDRITENLLK